MKNKDVFFLMLFFMIITNVSYSMGSKRPKPKPAPLYTYNWSTTNSCSKNCGGGIFENLCQRNDGLYVEESFCSNNEPQISCNQYSCPAVGVMCAITYRKNVNNLLIDKTFCATKNIGKNCDTPPEYGDIKCENGSILWYQDAIDYASSFSSSTRIPIIVELTRGKIELNKFFRAWGALGNYTGIHLKDGVHLKGSPKNFGETIIYPSQNDWKDAETDEAIFPMNESNLRSIILIAKNRKGNSTEGSAPIFKSTSNVRISDLTISGNYEADTNCTLVPTQRVVAMSAILSGAVAPDKMSNNSPLLIENIIARHFIGNAIELGLAHQWILEGQTEPGYLQCKSIDRLSCRAASLRVQGNQQFPVIVRSSDLCDGKFGGIVLIGDFINLEKNTIRKVARTWKANSSMSYGFTMGISASFWGTTNIKIVQNRIDSGDYGIGTDGSFPLYLSVDLFQKYWENIKKELNDEEFSRRYPDGPPLDSKGNLNFPTDSSSNTQYDYVRSQQVLFNMATNAARDRRDEAGFGDNLIFSDNSISNSTAAITLYRVKNVFVFNNSLITDGLGPHSTSIAGIEVNSSYSNFMWGNKLLGWPSGIKFDGAPGSASTLGSSYNGVGVIPPNFNNGQWGDAGNEIIDSVKSIVFHKAGYDNSVRSTKIKSKYGGDCDYRGAQRQGTNDWTTDNTLASCNVDY